MTVCHRNVTLPFKRKASETDEKAGPQHTSSGLSCPWDAFAILIQLLFFWPKIPFHNEQWVFSVSWRICPDKSQLLFPVHESPLPLSALKRLFIFTEWKQVKRVSVLTLHWRWRAKGWFMRYHTEWSPNASSHWAQRTLWGRQAPVTQSSDMHRHRLDRAKSMMIPIYSSISALGENKWTSSC